MKKMRNAKRLALLTALCAIISCGAAGGGAGDKTSDNTPTPTNPNKPIDLKPVPNKPIDLKPVDDNPVKLTPVNPGTSPIPVNPGTPITPITPGVSTISITPGQPFDYINYVQSPRSKRDKIGKMDNVANNGQYGFSMSQFGAIDFGIDSDPTQLTVEKGGVAFLLDIDYLATKKTLTEKFVKIL